MEIEAFKKKIHAVEESLASDLQEIADLGELSDLSVTVEIVKMKNGFNNAANIVDILVKINVEF